MGNALGFAGAISAPSSIAFARVLKKCATSGLTRGARASAM